MGQHSMRVAINAWFWNSPTTGSGQYTHHLVEAEGLADHVIVLDGGTDLVAGEPSDLVRRYWPEDSVEIEITGPPVSTEPLAAVDGVRAVVPTRHGMRVALDHPGVTPDIVDALVRAGARISRVVPHEPTLEELYFEVRRTTRDLGEGRGLAPVGAPTAEVAR